MKTIRSRVTAATHALNSALQMSDGRTESPAAEI